ncbi:solute carrier organic anion transporter family member 2A1-like isoform X1 [Ostrinia nubilalis]|uniref:solute carrier organic anion transporter family member 2A1-like isoform X1 n=1 Tax=Ostrinia nubilalis TaxID=29057 RepID=UPI003082366E
MGFINQVPVLHKPWHFLRTYVLTIPRFDLFLQGAMLIVILLDHNVFLLLQRDADTGLTVPLTQDFVLMGVGGAEFFLGAALAWWGRGKRNFALAGWLTAAAASGLVVLAFPFAEPNPPSVDLCGGGVISGYSGYSYDIHQFIVPRTVFLVLTAILCAFAKISIWAHGMTYLDDHQPENGPYFYGILISIRLSLGLSGKDWLRGSAVRDDWWEAQLSLSMLTLMFAVLFTLFPKRMHNSEGLLVEVEPDDGGFFAAVGRVLSRKYLILQIGALGFINAGLFSFVYYDWDYIEARYHVEAARADLRSPTLVARTFRPLVIIFFVMIFRVRFSVRRSDGVKANTASRVGGIVAIFVAIFFAVIAAISCDTGDVAGMEDGTFESPICSNQCFCESHRYGFAPVCALDTSTTYFSPCQAGCSDYEDLNSFLVFGNCTCSASLVVRGACALPSCHFVYSIYQVILTVILAVSGAALLMQGMVFLRAVQRRDKPVAMGVMLAAIGLLAHVLGHLLYKLISHLTCAYSVDGTCQFHRPTIFSMAAISAGFCLLSAIVSIIASKVAVSSKGENESNGGVDL